MADIKECEFCGATEDEEDVKLQVFSDPDSGKTIYSCQHCLVLEDESADIDEIESDDEADLDDEDEEWDDEEDDHQDMLDDRI